MATKPETAATAAASSPTIAERLLIVEAEIAGAIAELAQSKTHLGDILAFGSAAAQTGAATIVADLTAHLGKLELVRSSLRARKVLEDRDRLEHDLAAARGAADEASAQLVAAQAVCDAAVAQVDAAQLAWEAARRTSSTHFGRLFNLQKHHEIFYREHGTELEAAEARFGGAT
jgi:hypothetical protein